MKKLSVILVLVLAMSMMIVACGNNASQPAESDKTMPPAESDKTTQPEQTGDNGNVEKQLFVGLAMHNQTETWAVEFAKTFEAACKNDNIKVAITDANATPANQVSQIEDLVAQGIDVLVVLPADYTALGNALKTAKEAGVKIVNADSKVAEADQNMIDCFVTADCYKGGYNAGLYLAKMLPKDAVYGGLNYSQLSVIADRFKGLKQALKDQGRDDVKIVEKDCTDLSAIATYTEDLIIANPKITGFLCLNDNTALTCYGTCKQMNHAEAIVVGFDGSPAGKQSISAGEMTGTMVYSPVDLAKSSEQAALALAQGKTVEKETMVEMYMINKENIKDKARE